jgi:DNA transformation protein and related proteins
MHFTSQDLNLCYALRMSTKPETVQFLLDQLATLPSVRARAMFGEYALYCDEKVVALICDDQLFVKMTEPGRAFVKEIVEAPPYPGAKMHHLVSGELWDDSEWLSELIQLTAKALPAPKPKTKKKKK